VDDETEGVGIMAFPLVSAFFFFESWNMLKAVKDGSRLCLYGVRTLAL